MSSFDTMDDASQPLSAATTDAVSLPLTPTQALRQGFDFDAAGDAPIAASTQAVAVVTPRTLQDEQHQRQGFRIGSLGLMISYDQGDELAELPQLYRMPHAPSWFAGICNLHGALVPVFDLAPRLGIEHDAQAELMLLVLGQGTDAAGMVVDGIPQRLRFSNDAVADAQTVPAGLDGLITQAVLIDAALWFDLDVPVLLSALEGALEPSQ